MDFPLRIACLPCCWVAIISRLPILPNLRIPRMILFHVIPYQPLLRFARSLEGCTVILMLFLLVLKKSQLMMAFICLPPPLFSSLAMWIPFGFFLRIHSLPVSYSGFNVELQIVAPFNTSAHLCTFRFVSLCRLLILFIVLISRSRLVDCGRASFCYDRILNKLSLLCPFWTDFACFFVTKRGSLPNYHSGHYCISFA